MKKTQTKQAGCDGIEIGEESQFEIISSDELSDNHESDEEEEEEERANQIQRRVRVKTLRLESDFYGLYSLKFRVLEGSLVSEGEIAEDFGAFGSVVDIWGAGFVEQDSFDSEVFVRFEVKSEAVAAWRALRDKYRELTPAISDVLPDNFGLYTITFVNKVSVPTDQIHYEFSEFGQVVKLFGELDRRGGRVGVAFRDKEEAIEAFLGKCERWYEDMRFTLPHCETDYTGYYCLRFDNIGTERFRATEEDVRGDFEKFGEVVDVRGAGLFDVRNTEVYVRFREKSSAQHALTSLNGRYVGLCISPATRLRCDENGLFIFTFINKTNASQAAIYDKFKRFGPVQSVSGVFDTNMGRVFVAMRDGDDASAAIRDCMGDQDFHLQLAKGTKPWRVRSYGISSRHSVKERSIPLDYKKTNPARPSFQRSPSSYKSPPSTHLVRKGYLSLDARLEKFRDYKSESVRHLNHLFEEDRHRYLRKGTCPEDVKIKQELTELAGNYDTCQETNNKSMNSRDAAKWKQDNSPISFLPRDKNTFLSTKLSPVGSVMQSLKRPSSNFVEDDDCGEQLNKKQRVVVIRDPRRRKREEEKMEEEKKVISANSGLSLRHISNKLKKVESEEEEEIEEKKWARAGKEGPHESPLSVRKTMKLVENSVSAAKFYKYRQEREFNKRGEELEEDKENIESPLARMYKEVEEGEWDEEEESCRRSWDFKNRSGVLEEV